VLEVKIPSEIRAYKGKLVAGLSIRGLVAIAAMFAVGVTISVFGRNVIPMDILLWLIILAVAPIGLWGFVSFKGMKFEEYTRVLFKFYFTPQERVYEDVEENYLAQLQAALCAREILQQRIERGDVYEDEDFESEEGDYVF
jgi:hypothetical protein